MAASLDDQYILAPSLQEYFVDKDSGLPLTNGYVYFYEDQARTIPKPVYQIVSAAPGGPYTYEALQNPLQLSAVGTVVDANGNDIIPYYHPYDDAGGVELYYIVVTDSDGNEQFTREAWPNLVLNDVTADQDVTNHIPNGQFLSHNNIPATSANNYTAGEISQDSTIIAQGGWSFDRTSGSAATDIVTFPEYTTAITQPTGNPRFAVQIQTTVADADTEKDLRCKFRNVNRFASGTLPYNLYFEGGSATGSDITGCQLIVRKFFGTGGSPSTTTETIIDSFTLPAQSIATFNFSILFGTNESKSIGTNGDDYVQIVIRLPPTGVQTAIMTDFALTVNSEVLNSFPESTNAEQLDVSLAGWLPTPAPDGSDLYLPIRLTPTGMEFDHTEIGKIYAGVYSTPGVGELLCDGSTYQTSEYSSDGIPYARLQAVLLSLGASGVPLFGTGSNFATSYVSTDDPTTVRLSTNKSGAETAATDFNTGFTFGSIHTGQTTNVSAYSNGAARIFVRSNTVGAVTAPTDVSSGVTIAVITNTASTKLEFTIVTPAASTITTGQYFTYTSNSVNYYVWFNINGGGGDPAVPGATGIEVAIPSTYAAQEVSDCLREAISGFEVSTVTCAAASTLATGEYFTFEANSVTYYVWYKIGGTGTAPGASTGATAIQVDLGGSETDIQVAAATAATINQFKFATPNFTGMFLRGLDPSSTWDVNSSNRWSYISGYYGNNIGTFEYDQLISHLHAFTVPFSNQATSRGGGAADTVTNATPYAANTSNTGGAETRPVNAGIYWYIKY